MEEKKEDTGQTGTEPEKKKEETRQKQKKGGFRFILAMIIVGAMLPLGAPTLLVCLGLLPALVALLTDTDPRKSSAITIGFLNMAGVAPFVAELWLSGHTMEAALAIVRQPVNWLVMFGAAALGQALLYMIPPLVNSITVSRMEARLRVLKEGQEQLKSVWGPEVATSVPIEAIRRKVNQ